VGKKGYFIEPTVFADVKVCQSYLLVNSRCMA
jgi:hypothetical protein